MEQVKNEIKKAVVKKDRLNVVYNERFSESNYTNVINKSCDQIIHSDLREAFSRLKLHLVVLCEQPEASKIDKDSFTSPGYAETLENYIITGYANDTESRVASVCSGLGLVFPSVMDEPFGVSVSPSCQPGMVISSFSSP